MLSAVFSGKAPFCSLVMMIAQGSESEGVGPSDRLPVRGEQPLEGGFPIDDEATVDGEGNPHPIPRAERVRRAGFDPETFEPLPRDEAKN